MSLVRILACIIEYLENLLKNTVHLQRHLYIQNYLISFLQNLISYNLFIDHIQQ